MFILMDSLGWHYQLRSLRKSGCEHSILRIKWLTVRRIVEIAPPNVGYDHPAFVQAEIALDVSRLAENVRREWESLRQDDVVYLLAIQPNNDFQKNTNGSAPQGGMQEYGLKTLRAAEVVQILDESGRMIRDFPNNRVNGFGGRPRLRRLIVKLDAVAYKTDNVAKNKGKPDVYESINLIMRRKGRENNFKKILETIQNLTLADVALPTWLQEVFLGNGDPAGASYSRLENRIKAIDFRDTFLDWQHLIECLPGKVSRGSHVLMSQS